MQAFSSFRAPAVWAILLAGAGVAQAETGPYYYGVSAQVLHDSNLIRLGDSQPLGRYKSQSDTVYTASLVGGLDQTWRRQRFTGSASLRSNRYQNNDQLNYNGYGMNLGWDWETVERLSGNVSVSANRALRRFDSLDNGNISQAQNIETDRSLRLLARLGVVTRLTAEAGLSHSQTSYSADGFQSSNNRQTTGSLGMRYRLGGATTVGAGWRQGRVTYPEGGNGYGRRDLDLTAEWVPTGLSTVSGRISHSSTSYDTNSRLDFSGITWELRATTQATGKVRVGANLWHDTGLSSYGYVQENQFRSNDFNRSTTNLRFTADYAFSAKIAVNSALGYAKRNLSTVGNQTNAGDASDATTTFSLGARWTPYRSTTVGCDLTHETRSVTGLVSLPYGSTAFGCYGQFVLQP